MSSHSRATADSPLLTAKLSIPPLHPVRVARPRLTEQMDQLAHRRLALVAAPAGYGKTTMLVDWAHHSERPVAWLSLDESDNDLGRFLRYVVASWATVEPGIREGPLGLLAGSLLPAVDKVLSTLLNEAAARPNPPVLVLDDYHLVAEPAIHDALAFIIDHFPPQTQVVLSSRSDPSLPLARWRARGELVELRADDLRFTTAEAVEFFTQVSGASLPIEDVTALSGQAEGWIAGLQLAGLSLRGRDRRLGVAAAFSGVHRHIADYPAGEVLSQQPEAVRTFLLQTAIFDRLCGPLCSAVTGRTDGQAILEDLEQANLFLTPVNSNRVVPLPIALRRFPAPALAAHVGRNVCSTAPQSQRLACGARLPRRGVPSRRRW